MRPGPLPNTSWLSFSVDFAFQNALYRHVADLFFSEVVQRMMAAFEGRCAQLYGPSSLVLGTSKTAAARAGGGGGVGGEGITGTRAAGGVGMGEGPQAGLAVAGGVMGQQQQTRWQQLHEECSRGMTEQQQQQQQQQRGKVGERGMAEAPTAAAAAEGLVDVDAALLDQQQQQQQQRRGPRVVGGRLEGGYN